MANEAERNRQDRRDEELDRRLRAALEPSTARVGRVVRASLGARARRRPSLALVAALGTAAALLVLVGALLLPALRPATDREDPAAAVARFHVTNRDGVVVVRDADGGATLLHSRERPTEPPRGMRMIVRGGI